MDQSKLSLKVSRGYTYSYHHIPPSSTGKSYILFLHGFPSLPVDYYRQIAYFSSLGYGIIAPELLGYGDSSRPDEPEHYRLKLMAEDLTEILDHHSIRSLFCVAHDWGVTLLTRLEFYHPDRVKAMALLTIASAPMGQHFDLDAVNAMTKEHLGYEGYGYITLFTRESDAPELVNSHQASFRSLMYAENSNLWKQYFGPVGGTREWLSSNLQTQTVPSFTDKVREEHERAFSLDKGGYTATLNWYRAHASNLNIPDEQAELKQRRIETYQTTKPVLQILAGRDPIALVPVQKQMAEAYAPRLEIVTLDTGHWVMLEAPEEVNKALEQFVTCEE